MKHRHLFASVGLALSATLLAGCGSSEQAETSVVVEPEAQSFEWKLVTSWPKNFPGLGMGPERFATMVDEMSSGRLKVKVFGAGELVPALEVFDAVSNGTADMGHAGAYYWKGKEPSAQFFAAVPFGLNAQEMNSWIHYGGGQALWDEVYKPFNIKPFAGGSTGVQMAGWFNKEINSLDDIKGLKMRIPGMGGEVLKRLGGVPVTLPGGELFTALQTGAIDATEWVGPYNDLAFGFYKVASYYYYPGWHEPGTMLEFTINLDAWNALPEDLQAMVKASIRAVNQDMLDEYTARNNAALNQLVSEHGVKLRRLPDDVLKELKKTSDEVTAEVAATSDVAKRVYESFNAFRKQSMEYHKISEEAYYDARSL
ncbi:ABC transporter substrate-binding protein [Endozoicomonas montiporae]|uniref:ABC transporter substrate-binding protein n=2 Tax=Endozoicomonas montiporae TaxID=1027273 RepID=A0A081N0E1_9GAMM|nr:TRAP transporter substrate-binding protein [Endozoicomonas montiporae]AMO54369.1 TRAP-type mannitol/chloroaromatic compound transporter periplasmic protein [Endozoicomonas montiporae CL-33]KEQ11914.1 ABC transporter substrate-binding protein [Endozoicomonas montiporae]